MQQRTLTLAEAADYLEAATIEYTHDAGHAVIHMGLNAAGTVFTMVNDCFGQTSLTEVI